jgi:hypothetical protein
MSEFPPRGENGNIAPTLADAQRLLPEAVFLPIPAKKKGPQFKKWSETTFEHTQSERYQSELRTNGNTGVLLGAKSKDLCTIDCDTDALQEAMLALNPRLAETFRTRGQSGGQIWACMPGARPHKVYALKVDKGSPLARGAREEPDESGRVVIGEFRAEGGQSVICGLHPTTGKPYSWPVAEPPVTIAFDQLVWPSDIVIPWETARTPSDDRAADSLLKRAIAQLTVDDLWDHFAYGERETDPVRSPWYPQDVDTSFSVYDEGRRFKDHDPGRPDERGGSFDFYCRATGKTPKDAFEPFVILAGLGDELRKNRAAQDQDEEREARLLNELLSKYDAAIRTSKQLQSAEIKPRNKILGDWLREGDLGFIYGLRGAGKSWLVDAIATRVSTGTDLDSWQSHGALPVLYVDGEMPEDLTRDRICGLAETNDNLQVLHHEHLFDVAGLCMNLTDPLTQKLSQNFA